MDETENITRGELEDLFPIRDLYLSPASLYWAYSEGDIELYGGTVFAEWNTGTGPDPFISQLLKKAGEWPANDRSRISLVLIGSGIAAEARCWFARGADRIFVYDDPRLKMPSAGQFTAVFRHFLENYKPNLILGGANRAGIILLADLMKVDLPFPDKPLRISKKFKVDPSHRGELVLCEIPDLTN